MKIGVENETVVTAPVLILTHCVVDNLVHLLGPVEDIHKCLDNLLVVLNVHLRLNICRRLLDYLVYSIGEIGDYLHYIKNYMRLCKL